MRNLDFSSWPALLSTLLGLALITLIGVGIRLLAMYTIQQRRERAQRFAGLAVQIHLHGVTDAQHVGL